MRTRLSLFLLILMLTILIFQPSRASRAHAPKPFVAYLYVEVETKVYRKGIEISSENPEERRWYFKPKLIYRDKEQPNYGAAR